MDIDACFNDVKTEIITTQKLGMPRITEALFENPDGTPITVDTDILGNKRSTSPTAGAIEGISTGKVRVKII